MISDDNSKKCPICETSVFKFFEDSRPFYLCKNCGFIFTDCPNSPAEIVKHYQSQYVPGFNWKKEAKNIIDLVAFAVTPRKILDFGSGSGMLSAELKSLGFEVDGYEPMLHGEFKAENYASDYNLVILFEVIEHVSEINPTFDDILSVTGPGGCIYIGTCMTDAIIIDVNNFQERFRDWWYKDDKTHVSFFCQLTFEYLCLLKKEHAVEVLACGPNGVLIQKR